MTGDWNETRTAKFVNTCNQLLPHPSTHVERERNEHMMSRLQAHQQPHQEGGGALPQSHRGLWDTSGPGKDTHGTPVPEKGRPWVAHNNLHEDDHRQTTTRHRPVSRQTCFQETSADTHLATYMYQASKGEVYCQIVLVEITLTLV